MTPQDSTHASINTGVSIIAASISVSNIQPYVTLIAGLIAIVSGILAIIYYIKQIRKI